jgi:hypothetical protein
MPSFHDFIEAFPAAVACAGTVTLDGVVLCEHRHGEFIVTEHGESLYAAHLAKPAEEPKPAKKPKAEKVVTQAIDLGLPEDFGDE